MADMTVTPIVPQANGCPFLGSGTLYVVPQGTAPVFDFTVTDIAGNPVDLTTIAATVNEPGSKAGVLGRLKESIAPISASYNPLLVVNDGVFKDAANGVISLVGPRFSKSGVYELGLAVRDAAGALLYPQTLHVLVERSLFVEDEQLIGQGPPTIHEIRVALRDADPAQNTLLGELEFAAEDIVNAITRPVRFFNEIPPPLYPPFDTWTFAYREQWLRAIIGYLLLSAAHGYRRNHLPYSAGGKTIDDKNKFLAYGEVGRAHVLEYENFARAEKIAINQRSMFGEVLSTYSFRN